MQLLVEQLLRRGRELDRWVEVERGAAAQVRLVREDTQAARLPEFDDSAAPLLAAEGDWREPLNQTAWLRFQLTRPAEWPVEDTALVAHRFGTHPLEVGARIGRELQRYAGHAVPGRQGLPRARPVPPLDLLARGTEVPLRGQCVDRTGRAGLAAESGASAWRASIPGLRN